MRKLDNRTREEIAKSWTVTDGEDTLENIFAWLRAQGAGIAVEIRKCRLEDCAPWFYDREEGCIRNENRSFFTITGLEQRGPEGVRCAQPVILQEEIGYLGILCQMRHGVMHFLMQAKIEPGNVNCVQLSPTLQATKSNFTRRHNGAEPPYLDYFLRAADYEIIVDQLQSEQSSRFLRKRNRNILLRVDDTVPVLPTHKWMTLGQIKRLMREDNLVNMDTRTVISCIPMSYSIIGGTHETELPKVWQYINDYKMFSETKTRLIPLHQMENWEMRPWEMACREHFPYKVIYCDITIEGREVRHWTQPLFEATGEATFGLCVAKDNGELRFLVRAFPEVGCFDSIELGPTVQREAGTLIDNAVTEFFMDRLEQGRGVLFDHLLSEEGGRFYHEQNRNVLLQVGMEEVPPLPAGYFWLTFRTLNELTRINNILNIQLRNLLALWEA